jgi:hypothetical protein
MIGSALIALAATTRVAVLSATLWAALTTVVAPPLRKAEVKRTSLPRADAILVLAARDGLVIQRGESISFLPMHGYARESRLVSDAAFANGRIVRAFLVGSRLYLAIDPFPARGLHPLLYDVERHRRIELGSLEAPVSNETPSIGTLIAGPNGDAAIIDLRDAGPQRSFWVRFRDGIVKPIPPAWQNDHQFAGKGKWACFSEVTMDLNNDPWTRAVVMATGELRRPRLREHKKPTKEHPLVVSVEFGPVLDLGPEPYVDARDVSLPQLTAIQDGKFEGLRIGKRVALLPQLSPDTTIDPQRFAVAGEWAAVEHQTLIVTSLHPGSPLHTVAENPADWLLLESGHVLLRNSKDQLLFVDAPNELAWPLDSGMHAPTVEEAGSLPRTYERPKPHFYASFDRNDSRRIALVDLPLAVSESTLTHMQYGVERWRVQPRKLLVDAGGRRFEIAVAIPRDARVFVHDSGTIVVATPQTLERFTVRLPKEP